VEPNPGTTVVERGGAELRAFGTAETVVVPVGGGSSMDTAKAMSLFAVNARPAADLGYDDPSLVPGRPLIAVPTTAGTGAETNSFGVITDERAGRRRTSATRASCPGPASSIRSSRSDCRRRPRRRPASTR